MGYRVPREWATLAEGQRGQVPWPGLIGGRGRGSWRVTRRLSVEAVMSVVVMGGGWRGGSHDHNVGVEEEEEQEVVMV